MVNGHNWIGLETPYGRVLVNQIAGIMARRMVCWAAPGQALARGERLGMIKLGSRAEVYLPPGRRRGALPAALTPSACAGR